MSYMTHVYVIEYINILFCHISYFPSDLQTFLLVQFKYILTIQKEYTLAAVLSIMDHVSRKTKMYLIFIISFFEFVFIYINLNILFKHFDKHECLT